MNCSCQSRFDGAKLRELRAERLGWTLERLAFEADVEVGWIIGWESGTHQPSSESWTKLANALGVSEEELAENS